ncbi:biotin--[acetyl-CoA-carboxylase] ligase [Streptomyces tirandamycinicus]|uniref:biotin--[acetyl-CoA-carboxylase] ligase n=1 Tax=Streptomyces tirandamycinicus TaxID=2174846 RepID=UPI00037F1854|nr:biotin--[acetyl-CoA-carboxylase] ligase [Streptomyces tirandamycinicus]
MTPHDIPGGPSGGHDTPGGSPGHASGDTPGDTPGGRWSDLDRPPLNAAGLRRALVRPGGLWTSLDVVERVGSTNSDLVARAAELGEGAVLVAEEQTSGRGRLDRSWTAPPRSGLFLSVLLKPDVPVDRWGWLPLLTGVAAATGLARAAGADFALKWPNDLMVRVGGEERKAGGILAERVGSDGVVIGIGVNVTLREDELPVPQAGSLALANAVSTDRDPLLRALLRSLEDWYGVWRAANGDAHASRLQETYAAGCSTLGLTVRAELPGDRSLIGEAVAIDGDGRLVVTTPDGKDHPIGAGDIVHLRPNGR